MTFKRNGGLLFFSIGRFGGSFYLKKGAPLIRRADVVAVAIGSTVGASLFYLSALV